MSLGGYAGEWVSTDRPGLGFAPDRGMARALFGRGSLAFDASRTLTVEAVARRDGKGALGRAEYSRGLGRHWRVTMRLTVIGGSSSDFLGQYQHNSFGGLSLRTSF